MEEVTEGFVSHDYLCKCIDHPLDFVLLGIPTYIFLKTELLDVVTNNNSQGDFYFEGYVSVFKVDYGQNKVFKNQGYGPWSYSPKVLEVYFSKYSSRPDLANQTYIVGEDTPAFQSSDLLWNIEEIKAHCDASNITFHEPRDQQNPKFSLVYDNIKFELKEQPVDPKALLPESSNLPNILKLTIDAYNVWWRDTMKIRKNSDISDWLKEESGRRCITHTLKGEVKSGISGVTEKVILSIIRPEKYAINNTTK